MRLEETLSGGSLTFEPLLLTAPRAAEALAISERTLWDLTNRGEIRSIKIGRLVRYSIAELRRWIEEKSAASLSTGTTSDHASLQQGGADEWPA